MEYLLLGVIGLSLIIIALVSLRGINQNFIMGYDTLQFKNDIVNLNGAINEVCILGKGNQRIVTIKGGIGVQEEENHISRYKSDNVNIPSIPEKIDCNITAGHITKGNVVVTWNVMANKIELKQ